VAAGRTVTPRPPLDRIRIKVKRFWVAWKGGRDEKWLYEGNYEGKFETAMYME
jgi:hypothetical protein